VIVARCVVLSSEEIDSKEQFSINCDAKDPYLFSNRLFHETGLFCFDEVIFFKLFLDR